MNSNDRLSMTAPLSRVPFESRVTALIADHDSDTRRMYADYFDNVHFDVEEATDGRDALVKALARPHDAIVTELRLPFIDGYELCEIFRHDPMTRNTPILVVTAEAFRTDSERALRAGADSILVKPCLPEMLLLELNRLLRRSPPLQASGGGLRVRAMKVDPRADQLLQSPAAAGRGKAATVRRSLSHVHRRGDTISPPADPPALLCPSCGEPLAYRRSHIGGVSVRHAEQWDYYECTASACGTFQYRQRTRRLRRV